LSFIEFESKHPILQKKPDEAGGIFFLLGEHVPRGPLNIEFKSIQEAQ